MLCMVTLPIISLDASLELELVVGRDGHRGPNAARWFDLT